MVSKYKFNKPFDHQEIDCSFPIDLAVPAEHIYLEKKQRCLKEIE
jgi:hypothetical protein